MERELTLTIGISENGYPYVETMDVQSGLTMKVSGEGSRTFAGSLDKVAKGLWDEVYSWISLMQDEQEEE